MRTRWTLLGGLFLLALGLAGCATVRSTALRQTSPSLEREGIAYFLPRGKVQIKATRIDPEKPDREEEAGQARPAGARQPPQDPAPSTDQVFYQITIAGVIEPDPNFLFVLRPRLSAWATDAMQITLGSNGLLNSVSSTNSDETGEVIIALSQIAMESFKLAAGGLPLGAKRTQTRPWPKEVVVTFDPTKEADLHAARLALTEARLQLDVKADFTPFTKEWRELPKSKDESAHFDGFFYRPVAPFTISVSNTLEKSSVSQTVLLPNNTPILSFSPKRSPLVQRVTHITLENGTLKEISLNKPSSVLAGVKLPLTIIKSIVALPTDLLQLRVNYSSTNHALRKSQAEEIKALKEILDAQRALASARTNQNSTGAQDSR